MPRQLATVRSRIIFAWRDTDMSMVGLTATPIPSKKQWEHSPLTEWNKERLTELPSSAQLEANVYLSGFESDNLLIIGMHHARRSKGSHINCDGDKNAHRSSTCACQEPSEEKTHHRIAIGHKHEPQERITEKTERRPSQPATEYATVHQLHE